MITRGRKLVMLACTDDTTIQNSLKNVEVATPEVWTKTAAAISCDRNQAQQPTYNRDPPEKDNESPTSIQNSQKDVDVAAPEVDTESAAPISCDRSQAQQPAYNNDQAEKHNESPISIQNSSKNVEVAAPEVDTESAAPISCDRNQAQQPNYSHDPTERDNESPTGDFSGSSSDEFKPSSSSSSSSDSSSSSSSDDSNSDDDVVGVVNEELPQKQRGRKRTRNPENWKKNIAKRLKNSGQEYCSIKTGKIVGARKMGLPCTDKCRLSCSTKLTTIKRTEIFDTYWNLGSVERQRNYLNACTRPLQVASRRIKTNSSSRKPRQENTAFYLLSEGQEIRVCKTFLISTLGISQRTIRTVIDAKKLNDGVIPQDQRGKHINHCKLSDEVIQAVKAHIDSIPKIESHYLRANTSRLYIDGGLTVAELHRNYTDIQKKNNKPTVNYDAYSRIFNQDFNIGFYKPKKDLCDECVAYQNASEEEKRKLHARYQLHQEEKSLSRIEKEKDMKECQDHESTKIVIIYDLQAVLPCPVGNSSAFFYKSRLNCYNFTMTNARDRETTCFFWHEGLGNRGSIEIGSCVYTNLKEVADKNPGCNVVFYSDNCCGQQKNRFVFAMYYYAVTTLNINSIQHNFLIRGHTQNEGDTAHSVIEKAITRAKKSRPIYVPEQYISLITSAKKTGKPFVVKEMNYTDFFDLKSLADNIKFNMTKNINGETIKISEIKNIKFTKNNTNYQYRTTYKTVNWNDAKAVIEPRGRNLRGLREQNSIEEITLKSMYTSKIPITERKKRDLLQLIETNIVPRYYEKFFNDLIT